MSSIVRRPASRTGWPTIHRMCRDIPARGDVLGTSSRSFPSSTPQGSPCILELMGGWETGEST